MPTRVIKDNICRSDDYQNLSLFCRDMFIRLIVTVDDYGRYDARPSVLKGVMYPLDNVTNRAIEDGLRVMGTVGMVQLYEVDGRPFLQLTSWQKHQQIRAKKSKYPAPGGVDSVDNITCIHLKSNDCKCSRNPIQSEDNNNCDTCPLGARAREIDALYTDLRNEEIRWPDVLNIAKQMLGFDMQLVRKAVLLSYTSQARDPVAYMFALAADWVSRGITTYKEFKDGKGER
jgi:hypothetical protein